MPRSSTTGVFARVSNSFSNPVFGTLIDPADAETYFDDLDVGLNPPEMDGPVRFINSLQVGTTGTAAGTVDFLNATSGTITLSPPTGALGTRTLTLPIATDTLVGKDTTDTLTNKTLTSPTLNTPTLNSPTLVTPALGVATATSINKVAFTAPATSATLTIPDGVTLTGPAVSGTAMTLGNAETVTGVKTFGAAGNVGKLTVAGTTSGSTVLNATAVASGTLTLPAATDTLVGKATTDVLTNKTFDSAGTGNVMQVSSVTLSRGQFPGTNTNNSATAGNIGEYVESILASGSATSLSSATAKTITSISLTAGDWDVSCVAYILGSGATFSQFGVSISGTTNTLDTTEGKINFLTVASVPGGSLTGMPLPPYRLLLSGTTTVFLIAQVTFSAGTSTGYGIIRARRVR